MRQLRVHKMHKAVAWLSAEVIADKDVGANNAAKDFYLYACIAKARGLKTEARMATGHCLRSANRAEAEIEEW